MEEMVELLRLLACVMGAGEARIGGLLLGP